MMPVNIDSVICNAVSMCENQKAQAQKYIDQVCGKLISRWMNATLWSAFESWHINTKALRHAEEVRSRMISFLILPAL